MPIIKSAKKRVRVAAKNKSRNQETKGVLRAALKKFAEKATDQTLREAQAALDTAAKKGIIHKNKAARKKAQLAATAKTSSVKPAKTVAKKAAPKASTAKKPAAKSSKPAAAKKK